MIIMTNLNTVVDNLKNKPEVDCVFLTGSQGAEHKPYSDIDLVIIFDRNMSGLKSLYTWMDGQFADVFFFDHADIERIRTADVLSSNTMDAVLVDWLKKSNIIFDRSGKTSALKEARQALTEKFAIPTDEKSLYLQKINYNLIANTRYFESNDPIYHEALEIRLQYSFAELITGYFEFRNIPWRGEKAFLKHVKEHDPNFYALFQGYIKAASLKERFGLYTKMAHAVFTDDCRMWNAEGVFPQPKDWKNDSVRSEGVRFWKKLISH